MKFLLINLFIYIFFSKRQRKSPHSPVVTAVWRYLCRLERAVEKKSKILKKSYHVRSWVTCEGRDRGSFSFLLRSSFTVKDRCFFVFVFLFFFPISSPPPRRERGIETVYIVQPDRELGETAKPREPVYVSRVLRNPNNHRPINSDRELETKIACPRKAAVHTCALVAFRVETLPSPAKNRADGSAKLQFYFVAKNPLFLSFILGFFSRSLFQPSSFHAMHRFSILFPY